MRRPFHGYDRGSFGPVCTTGIVSGQAFHERPKIGMAEKFSTSRLFMYLRICRFLRSGRRLAQPEIGGCRVVPQAKVMHPPATWFRLIDDQGNVISGDMDWEHLERREAPWRHSYGLTQIFHRSLLEFTDLWESSEDHFDPGQHMGHDHWIRFLTSLLGHPVSIKEVLLYYRQHTNSVVGWWSPADRVKPNTIAELMRTFGSKEFKKRKRQELITFMERRVAAASARGTIARKVAARVDAERAPQALSKAGFYSDYTQYLAARLSAYQSSDRGQRVSAMLSAVRKGQYRARGKRGARDAAIDVLYGVMG